MKEEVKPTNLNEIINFQGLALYLSEVIKSQLKELNTKPQPQEDENTYYNVEETANLLRCSKQTIYYNSKKGKLKPLYVGGKLLFTKKAINDFIKKENEYTIMASNGEKRKPININQLK